MHHDDLDINKEFYRYTAMAGLYNKGLMSIQRHQALLFYSGWELPELLSID